VVLESIQTGNPFDLVIIDYIQLTEPEQMMPGNRRLEIDTTSLLLKSICKEFKVPVIAISALKRTDQFPSKSDLKESGGLEYQADNVILLWRGALEPQRTDVAIDKARSAQTGRFMLYYIGSQYHFSEYPISDLAPHLVGEPEDPFAPSQPVVEEREEPF
jgi:replicative DNA helicase